MSTIVEMLWDCSYCHTKGILGHEYFCPNCGRHRSKETKFYLPDVDKVVEEPIDKRPDWYCDSCGSYNRAADSKCRSCGAPHTDVTYFDVRGQLETATYPITENISAFDGDKDYKKDDDGPSQSYKSTVNFAPTQQHRNIIPGIAIVIFAILLGIILWPKSKVITVNRTDWSRSIQIEQNTLVEENDWSLPADAVELLYTRQEIHHYDHVLDHYETVTEQKSRQVEDGYDITYVYRDLGNGYAEREEHRTPKYRTEYYTETYEKPVYRDEPVYRTKYYYTIWRYKYHHSVTASDYSDITNTVEPYWPEYQLVGDQREGVRAEKYTITCTDEGKKEKSYTCDYELYSQFIPGNSYKVKTAFGRITKIVQ